MNLHEKPMNDDYHLFRNPSNQWANIDNSAFPATFWATEKPKLKSGRDCGILRNGKLEDDNCSDQNKFICKLFDHGKEPSPFN